MRVKIINTSYTIIWSDPAALEFAEAYGFCNKESREIHIDNSLDAHLTRDTLWHEILHALWSEWKFPEAQSEEDTVTWLARAIEVFISDNPQFVRKYLC